MNREQELRDIIEITNNAEQKTAAIKELNELLKQKKTINENGLSEIDVRDVLQAF